MKRITLICIGRLKNPHWKTASAHYEKLLSRHFRLAAEELRDAPASLPAEERVRLEGEAILARLPDRAAVVCLDERGAAMSSMEFSRLLREIVETGLEPVFVLGGPYGLSGSVRERARLTLSLGPMTLPHELARVVLTEQIWRAVAIWRNIPYHNA
ncbi:Ribosomal RNA large subunit methyltransferase H [Alkalidesulfovibrio alkalitolerans DSM 16529]|uniref:Ribosomal RNA large subunit methyltransferase H n=1 Tax=Alkalidesulfovibrio alkalitolerans DSM 16529 TaxID=1121439 RepID=S7UPJ4_9BACT|nr:23S rRNA (pseudouridine(1915)-N(3))-methyltransferase RlmH [Alkalidesulfovibrio alkalitolerans]EPR34223.1 Ribosomal RNA large subunit methyltransferase H [Alkalidesulfovibrio alkalitolerans DSM 16529]